MVRQAKTKKGPKAKNRTAPREEQNPPAEAARVRLKKTQQIRSEQ